MDDIMCTEPECPDPEKFWLTDLIPTNRTLPNITSLSCFNANDFVGLKCPNSHFFQDSDLNEMKLVCKQGNWRGNWLIDFSLNGEFYTTIILFIGLV